MLVARTVHVRMRSGVGWEHGLDWVGVTAKLKCKQPQTNLHSI